MQEQIKQLKQKNTQLEMNDIANNDRVSDVNNLIKMDVRDLINDLNNQIKFYKQKSEEYEDMSTRISE